MRIVIATKNQGKVREFREMLGGGGIDWVDLAGFEPLPEVAETGLTFHANASLKASAYARRTGCWALADDSGLEVEALRGKPGVLSARWADQHGDGHGDEANNRLLLRQLATVPDERRAARFVCALALADPKARVVLTASDTVAGAIGHERRGSGGFGYDPLFVVEGFAGLTTAELSSQQKHAISHRGKALRRMRALMDRLGLRGVAGVPG